MRYGGINWEQMTPYKNWSTPTRIPEFSDFIEYLDKIEPSETDAGIGSIIARLYKEFLEGWKG